MKPGSSRSRLRRNVSARVTDAAVEVATFAASAAASVAGRIIAFAAVGAFFGLVVALALFLSGLMAHPWGPWAYLRWVVFLLYPLAGAIALGWGGAWRGIGTALVEAGVERGFVDYVAEGLVEQATRTLPRHPPAEDTNRSHWRAPLRRLLRAYEKEDPNDGTSGLARRLLRRLNRFVGRSLVRLLLGRAELLALFAGAVDGSAEAKEQLIRRLEDLFAEHVVGLTRRPLVVALIALPIGYALVPLALALSR